MAIALPIAAQNFITIGMNFMDTVMLGALGESALSASALANQYIHIYQICCMGIGMGASVLISRFFGEQDWVSLKKSITVMLRFMGAFALFFMSLTLAAPDGIMSCFTRERQVAEMGSGYLLWSVPTFLLLGISVDLGMVLRSVGNSKIPMLCSSAGFAANIFFNWVFIFGNLGAPQMGVSGAALGTLLARTLETGALVFYFFRREEKISYRISDLKTPCRDLMADYMRICIPVLISDTLLALGNTMVTVIMGHIGSEFVAANAITSVTQQLSTVITSGFFQAACIMTGQTLGEGKIRKAREEGWKFLKFGIAAGVFGAVVILLAANPLISIYSITEETAQIARKLMRAVALMLVFQTTNSILTKGVLRGGGDTKFLMVADILFLWIAAVPLGYFAAMVWRLDAFWIYFFLKIDQMIKCVWCVWRMKSGKWIKAIRRAPER